MPPLLLKLLGRARAALERCCVLHTIPDTSEGRESRCGLPLGHTSQLNVYTAFSNLSHDYPTATNRTPCKLRGENSSSHKLGFVFGNLDSFITMASCTHAFFKAFKIQNSLLVNEYPKQLSRSICFKVFIALSCPIQYSCGFGKATNSFWNTICQN